MDIKDSCIKEMLDKVEELPIEILSFLSMTIKHIISKKTKDAIGVCGFRTGDRVRYIGSPEIIFGGKSQLGVIGYLNPDSSCVYVEWDEDPHYLSGVWLGDDEEEELQLLDRGWKRVDNGQRKWVSSNCEKTEAEVQRDKLEQVLMVKRGGQTFDQLIEYFEAENARKLKAYDKLLRERNILRDKLERIYEEG
jgi:hypothetical protein